MPRTTLPQETLDYIVDWVARDNPESLKDVAATSWRLLERSRRHLFRNVYFADTLNPAPRTWKILHRNPSMFRYGRQLIINPNLPSFLVSESEFLDTINHLKKIEAADINISPKNYNIWAKFELFNIFSDLVHLSATFHQNMPLDVLYSMPKLRELRVTYPSNQVPTRWVQNPPEDPDLRTPPWKLKSLRYYPIRLRSLGPERRPIDAPFPLMTHSKLHRAVYGSLVHLSFKVEDITFHTFLFSNVLPACEISRLETLQLWYGDKHDTRRSFPTLVPNSLASSIKEGLSVPTLPNLRYFSIVLHTFRKPLSTTELRRQADSIPPTIPHHLAEFTFALLKDTVQPSLEAIDLLLSWDTRGRSQPQLASEELIVHNPCWDALDTTLTSRALYPFLHAVRITLQLEDEPIPESHIFTAYRSPDESELGHALREQMLAALPLTVGDTGLLVDVGSTDTQRSFEKIINPILEGAWEHRPLIKAVLLEP